MSTLPPCGERGRRPPRPTPWPTALPWPARTRLISALVLLLALPTVSEASPSRGRPCSSRTFNLQEGFYSVAYRERLFEGFADLTRYAVERSLRPPDALRNMPA